jgi:hypothetical protein
VPTILLLLGWRFYFYANENNEPVHVHVAKGDMEGKFWLNAELFEVVEAFSFNLKPNDKKIVRKIIFEHFDYIIEQWTQFQKKKL